MHLHTVPLRAAPSGYFGSGPLLTFTVTYMPYAIRAKPLLAYEWPPEIETMNANGTSACRR